jgi:DNA-binding SARP family transcriptional activator
MGLRIDLLGKFRVWRDDVQIEPEEWRTEKAKALLKILLTERRVFTQDELIEYLWPDFDPDKAAVNLRVRISELRHILEPDLERGSQSRYILTHPRATPSIPKPIS